MKVTNAPNAEERLRATVRFGESFAGVLTRHTAAAWPAVAVQSRSPPRRSAPLRAAARKSIPFNALDGVTLRLHRYRVDQGPVILSHGWASPA